MGMSIAVAYRVCYNQRGVTPDSVTNGGDDGSEIRPE
jgi:hypothetical protein